MFTRRRFLQTNSLFSMTYSANLRFNQFEPDEIIKIIEDCNLDQEFNTWTGDCVNIAVAISEVFEVDAIYELGVRGEQGIGHAFVVKNEVYIDGKGEFNMPGIWKKWPQIERQPKRLTIKQAKNETIYEENTKDQIKAELKKHRPLFTL